MFVSDLKAILQDIPDDYQVHVRVKEAEKGLGGHPVYRSVPVSDWTYFNDTETFGLYFDREDKS